MTLEFGNFPVSRVVFGPRTGWRSGVLTINGDELTDLLSGPAFQTVDVELVSPGEDARIIHVLDAVEPRAKPGGAAYPGFGGSIDVSGHGRTHRLTGAALLTSCEVPWRSRGGLLMVREGVIEMRGEAAMYSPFSETNNVVLVLRPTPDLTDEQYDEATRETTLRAASYLGQTIASAEPVETERFELRPVDRSLPKVVYICQVQSQGTWARTFLYGQHLDEQLPTLLHPNEILDGALVSGNQVYQNHKIPTWLHANNPIVRDLYRRHGRDLEFAGVVLSRGFFYSDTAKARSAKLAARLAGLLHADGVVLTWEGGGNSMIEAMMTVQACEQRGIKTSLVSYEMAGADGDQFPLLFTVPEADAIVSTGNSEEPVSLPAVSRVIGGDTIRLRPELGGERLAAAGPLNLEMTFELYCAANRLGAGSFRARAH